MRYRELGMKDRFAAGITEEECLELLSQDGMLVKRPIVVGEDFVLVGFKEADWQERLL
jgi:arsenate reductase